MCSIMAVVNNAGVPVDVDAFNEMLWLSRERGTDANGVVLYKGPDDWALIKEPGYFLRLPNTADIRECRAILGHSRQATCGDARDYRAAHPHQVGKLVMVHNGTCRTALQMAKDLKLDNPSESDSYAILALVEWEMRVGKKTLAQAIQDVFVRFNNSGDFFSVIILNTADGEMFTIRESGRPLVLHPYRQRLVMASERSFIEHSHDSDYNFGMAVENYKHANPLHLYRCNVLDRRPKYKYIAKIELNKTYNNSNNNNNSNVGAPYGRGSAPGNQRDPVQSHSD